MTSDIEKAFLQVGIQKQDRDAARFLWVKEVSQPVGPTNIVVYRFSRVFFGCIASSFLLEATIVIHLLSKIDSDPVAKEILDNHYVDNVHGGRESVGDAIDFYTSSKSLFQSAQMNLREWFSNDPSVMASVPVWDRGVGQETKVLGLTWSVLDDTLRCGKSMTPSVEVRTKRQVLQQLATVYDPLGFFSPVLLPVKLLMQELWLMEFGWDDPLPSDVIDRFRAYQQTCSRIPEHSFQRHFEGLPNSDVSIHCFCDASKKAYAAVVYLVASGKSSLVMAKCRVSPAKRALTIPRLELMAALIGVRLLNFVCEQIRLTVVEKYLWSDSQCVLAWWTSPQVLTPFVENRMREIRACSGIIPKYVPTNENPADVASRGCDFEALRGSKTWWHGPAWICKNRETWPVWEVPRKVETVAENADVLTAEQAKRPWPVLIRSPFDITTYSSLPELVRLVAWLKRFIHNCRLKSDQRNLMRTITTHEYRDSLNFLVKSDQAVHFGDLANRSDSEAKHLKGQLGIFLDSEGFYRCRGRFKLSDMVDEGKNPILLAKQSWLATLLVRHTHGLCCHGGPDQTLAMVRLTFWIPNGKSFVKRVVNQCRLCRKVVGGPFRYPKAPDLPKYRVSRSRPFDAVGADHLGPLYITTNGGEQKVWLILFTCAATRAIHLEVVTDLTAEQVLMSIQRFAARFGTPTIIVSDNAKNYQACEKFLQQAFREAFRSDKIQQYSAEKGISWSFITERAPWMGGFWERLVRSVKKALRKCIQKRKLTLVELQTVAAEVTACINSRPLVLAAECGETTLCPQNFLTGESSNKIMPAEPICVDEYKSIRSTKQTLKVAWNRIQAVANMFWKAWYGMYLPSLRTRKGDVYQRGCNELSPLLGSVVQIKDENLKRGSWRLGKIVKIIKSADDKIHLDLLCLWHPTNSLRG